MENIFKKGKRGGREKQKTKKTRQFREENVRGKGKRGGGKEMLFGE